MTLRISPQEAATDLRRQAAERIGDSPSSEVPQPGGSLAGLLRELEVHRVELEVQNEELRQARVELEHGLDRYTRLFDFAPIGYACLSVDRTVREVNHAGAALLAMPRAWAVGEPFEDRVRPSDQAKFEALIERLLATGSRQTCEVGLLRGRGRAPVVRITATLLAHEEAAILLAFEDVTAQKRAEKSLRRADKSLRDADRRKDEFLALLSHELRRPLSTLLLHGQILQSLDHPKARRCGEAIERAARTQARLIDDLLDVSRIVTGKMSMKIGDVDVASVVRNVVDAASPEAERKEVGMNVHLEPEGSSVSGDPARLQQAIANLVTNAIKFTSGGGRVSVALDQLAGRVRLEVCDTGEGIDPAFLPHVFERFSQADQSSTRSAGGLGLGLSIAHAIVQAHGGTIEAGSPGRGKGSTFTMSLPMAATESRPTASQRPDRKSITALIRGARLLVVEDDPGTRATLTEVLTAAGAEVREAGSSRTAVKMLRDFKPDVLLCDIAMPEEDGCALLRRIRALGAQRGGAVPALALTAFGGAKDRARTRAAGFAAHLVKPVDVEQLLTAVSGLLRRKSEPGESDQPAAASKGVSRRSLDRRGAALAPR